MPARFQGAARKWDSMQSRSFLVDDTCYDKKDKTLKERVMLLKETYLQQLSTLFFSLKKNLVWLIWKFFYSESEIHAVKEISEKEHMIRKLINENKLNIIYDKLPSSYTGYRPYIAYGMPIKKRDTYQLAD